MADVFAVTLTCGNCGKEWEQTHPPRTVVKWDKYQSSVVYRDEDCTEMGYDECECCGHVRCPVCDLLKPVEVSDRVPLEDIAAESDDAEASA